jgi:F-type H+-transporting ATPase subunit delta
MKDRKLAFRYAKAMLLAVKSPEIARQVEQFLNALGSAMAGSRELRESLLNPAMPRPTRIKLLTDLAKTYNMPQEVHRFLVSVVEHRRIGNLPDIAEVFQELREKSEGVLAASITSALPMSDDMARRTREALEKMTGKNIRLEVKVDSNLIGGAVTRIGSMIYDGSLQTQLNTLRRKMVEG